MLRSWTPRRRGIRDQRGASLLLVLALVAFLGLTVPAVLGLVSTGARSTHPVKADRRGLYAASSALEAAIEFGRSEPDVGMPGGPCPDQLLDANSLVVTVTCHQHSFPDHGCLYLDRFVTFLAEVRRAGTSDVVERSAAEVVYRFDHDTLPAVEVRQWDNGVTGPPRTVPLPPCAPAGATTSTSTTTSTTVPLSGAYAAWQAPSTESRSGNEWRAVGPVHLADHNGVAIEDADVLVAVEYLSGNGTWIGAGSILGSANAAGSITFHSPWYRRSGNSSVAAVRLSVLEVTGIGDLVWISAAHPVTIEIFRP